MFKCHFGCFEVITVNLFVVLLSLFGTSARIVHTKTTSSVKEGKTVQAR